MSGSPRHLRDASSDEQPDRLFDTGAGHRDPVPSLDLSQRGVKRPHGLMRLGPSDLPAAVAAIRDGVQPTAIVTGIGEAPEFTTRVRHVRRDHGLCWLVDHLLFKTTFDGYRTAVHLQDLDYTPDAGSGPYSVEQLQSGSRKKRIARAVIRDQLGLPVSGVFAGALVADSPRDPRLRITRDMQRIGIDARDLHARVPELPLVQPVILRMAGFMSLESQLLLVRALSQPRPESFILLLDGVHEDSSAQRLAAAIRLTVLLRLTGASVCLGRAGDLRRLFLPFLDGIEYGLGRLLRFQVSDYSREKKRPRPGPVPLPRHELRSLVGSLGAERARRAIELELVEEVECDCPACTLAKDLDDRLELTPRHDAHMVGRDLDAVVGIDAPAAISFLEDDLRGASHRWADLKRAGVIEVSSRRCERWLEALEIALAWGVLEPERLVEQLELV